MLRPARPSLPVQTAALVLCFVFTSDSSSWAVAEQTIASESGVPEATTEHGQSSKAATKSSDLAWELFDAAHYDEAIVELNKQISREPNNAILFALRSYCWSEKRDAERAL